VGRERARGLRELAVVVRRVTEWRLLLSRPRLLLVDDSDAILAFERTVLSGLYDLTTASNGREAMERIDEAAPDAVLLDLSMPEMDGEAVVAAMRKDRSLAHVPIVLVSSESKRAESIVGQGAQAFVAKPIRPEALLSTVARVLEAERERARRSRRACVVVEVADRRFALPLDRVRSVVPELTTTQLSVGPDFLRESIVVHGEPILVADLARRFESPTTVPRLDRILLVVDVGAGRLALRVDRVHDPVEIDPDAIVHRAALGGVDEHEALRGLDGFIAEGDRFVPLVNPDGLFDDDVIAAIASFRDSRSAAPPPMEGS